MERDQFDKSNIVSIHEITEFQILAFDVGDIISSEDVENANGQQLNFKKIPEINMTAQLTTICSTMSGTNKKAIDMLTQHQRMNQISTAHHKQMFLERIYMLMNII